MRSRPLPVSGTTPRVRRADPAAVTAITEAPSVRFAVAARAAAEAARQAGLIAPAFRTPPRLAGATRTIRRQPHGVVVSIAVKGRPFGAVIADVIEGVVVANRVEGAAAGQLRDDLWQALVESGARPSADASPAAALAA